MKKKLYTMVCLLLVLALPLAAFAQDEPEMDLELEGFVTEIVEGGFLMEDAELGEIMLNTSEATVWDGLLAEQELEAGQYVMVQFNGATTFSLPPQAHADRVGMHTLNGSVTEVHEDGLFMMEDEIHGTVAVLYDETLPVYAGMPVTVYYDGVMTLSFPARVSARHIVLPEITGVVSNWSEESFTLTDAEGVEYEVLMNEETIFSLMPEEILEDAEMIETDEAAEEEEIAEEEGNTEEEENPEEEGDTEGASAVEWGDESLVTVYYNGMMSRSIPAQITAMEIRVME